MIDLAKSSAFVKTTSDKPEVRRCHRQVPYENKLEARLQLALTISGNI